MAAHNSADSIPLALKSIARQSFKTWECLVVDDASSDNTAELVDTFVEKDQRFKLIQLPQQVGPALARNAAFGIARGKYIAVFDSDDVMHSHRLELQIEKLCDPSNELPLAGVACWGRYFPQSQMQSGMLAYQAWLNSMQNWEDVALNAFVEMPVGHPCLMIRREALESLGGWRDCAWPEDWDLFLRMHLAAMPFGIVSKVLHGWHLSPKSLSRQSEKYSLKAFMKCRSYYLANSFLADCEDYILWGFGETGKHLRRELAHHNKNVSKIVELHPGRLGNIIHGAEVISPKDFAKHAGKKIVVSVAGAQARRIIRASLADLGQVEGRDFIVAA